jgi:hypothetical protein
MWWYSPIFSTEMGQLRLEKQLAAQLRHTFEVALFEPVHLTLRKTE